MEETIYCTTSELAALAGAIELLQPSEGDPASGIAIVDEDGHRSWRVWSDRGMLATTPAPADRLDSAVTFLPARAIRLAERFADSCGVELHVGDADVEVFGEGAVCAVSLPAPRPVPAIETADGDPRVLADAASLAGAIDAGRIPPVGVDLELFAPDFVLLAGTESTLEIRIDWRAVGAGITSATLQAFVTHDVARSLDAWHLSGLLRLVDGDAEVELVLPADGGAVLRSAAFTATFPATPYGIPAVSDEPTLFDVETFAGATPVPPLDGASVVDVQAFAMDPDIEARIAAARSAWNWDARVQRAAATDPDERVVLAFLGATDPGVEACELIIAGPHTAAKAELAGRRLIRPLIEALAADADPDVSSRARDNLAARGGLAVTK